jgi:hypothetical protein
MYGKGRLLGTGKAGRGRKKGEGDEGVKMVKLHLYTCMKIR